jgi:hypothetical protein
VAFAKSPGIVETGKGGFFRNPPDLLTGSIIVAEAKKVGQLKEANGIGGEGE